MKTKLTLEKYKGETYLILPNETLASVGMTVGTKIDVSIIDRKLVIQSIESMKNKADHVK